VEYVKFREMSFSLQMPKLLAQPIKSVAIFVLATFEQVSIVNCCLRAELFVQCDKIGVQGYFPYSGISL
ncbi:hypothetical protein ACLBSV_31245, partial [Klebsiella pneumoniae]|uniref:hypothetical protein n=1 Tax=Klebsiella pneumoniae TaxID=573 RepID=UPI003968BED4